MSKGKPKFDTKAARVRFAIRKKYLSDEEWTNAEIADELNVSERVVSKYLNETPQAEEVMRAREAVEKEQWRQMITDLNQRIDRLSQLENQLWDVVEPVITSYEMVPAEAEIKDFHLQEGGNSVALELDEQDRPEVDIDIPVPERWKEVPQFSRLRSVWDERRRTEQQLTKLLGLEADDTLRLEGEVTERKVFQIGDDEYPDAEPHPVGEEPAEDETGADDDENADESGEDLSQWTEEVEDD